MENLQAFLQKRARAIVYAAAFIVALCTFAAYSNNWKPTTNVQNAFGYLAFSFISLSLAVTPLRILFPAFQYNAAVYMARRALGVSGFVFAFLHFAVPAIVFFKLNFLYFMPSLGEAGTAAGIAALAMLFLLAATSFDFAVKRLGKRWFALHKLVYLAYPLIIAHAYLLGADFGSINAYSGSFMLIAAATVLLEAARLWKHFSKKKAAEAPAGNGAAQG